MTSTLLCKLTFIAGSYCFLFFPSVAQLLEVDAESLVSALITNTVEARGKFRGQSPVS